MSPDRFYPYRTAAEQIRLAIDPADIELGRGSDGSLLAYGDDTEVVNLRLSIAIPDSVFEQVVAPAELADPPLDVRVVYRSIESRKRCVLSVSGDGIYEGTLSLRRQDWRGAVEMQALLIRTREGDGLPAGFASARGALLAWSAPGRVLIDEPHQPPGGQLRVRWEDFASSSSHWRRQHAGDLFALDTTEDPPVIFLNLGIPQAYPVLQSAGTRGPKARIRDATYSMIVHQVWSSLLSIALAELAATSVTPGEEDQDPEDRLGQIADWQQGIIRDWSSYLYPDRDPESALQELVLAADAPGSMTDVMSRLPNAIQMRLRTVRGFQGLVREGERM